MTCAVALPSLLTDPHLFGPTTGYMVLGLIFLPVCFLFSLPTIGWAGPSVHPPVVHAERNPFLAFFGPLKNRLFRRLLLVFVVNGSALGVAVTVILFYVEHVLVGTQFDAFLILLTYFISGAVSVPMWLVVSKKLSKASAWFVGMICSIVGLGLALFLGAGDLWWFLAISVLTGLGLGADYGLPPSILADVINSEEGGDSKGKTGSYFGLWALATKVATALGAALSLPVVAILGFNPAKGQYSTTALVIVYVVLPVVIKGAAAVLIWFIRIEALRGSVRDEMRGQV
jgi:Na+/melibiose symporter-like transporter